MNSKRKYAFCLSLLFLLVIICLFYLNNNDFEKHYINIEHDKIVDLNSFYDENSLTFKEKNGIQDNIEYTYIELDGLKKAKVENNINKDIKNKIFSLISSTENNYNKIVTKVCGNFGNILSINFYGISVDETSFLDSLNYNLVSGSMLTLDSLMISDKPINDIIKNEFSSQLKKITNSQDTSYYLEHFDNNQYKFYFDSFAVYIVIDNKLLNIPYYKYPDYFTLYDKYLTNVSIYKNNNVGEKDILTASYRNNGVYSILDYNNKNMYIDLVVDSTEENINSKVLNSIQEIIEMENQKIGNEIFPKYIYLNQTGNLRNIVSFDETQDTKDYKIYEFKLESHTYIVPEKNFKETLKETVYDLHRQNKNVDNFVNYNEKIRSNFSNSWVILPNGNLLNKVDDLFDNKYDYKFAIKKYIEANSLISDDNIDNQLNNATYKYQLNETSNHNYSVIVTLKNNQKIYVPFNYFDKKLINIY